MFENRDLLCVMNDGTFKKFQMTKDVGKTRKFFEKILETYESYDHAPYVYGYQNNFDELSYVDFSLDPTFIKYIMDCSSLPTFSILNDVENLKYIFMGDVTTKGNNESLCVVFQRIRSNQILGPTSQKLRFIGGKDTVSVYDQSILSVNEKFDCYFSEGKLIFKSVYDARTIFDMNEFIKKATDNEVKAFGNFDLFKCNEAELLDLIDTTSRGRIKAILDQDILPSCTIEQIENIAKKVGLELSIIENDGITQIALPSTKKEFKTFLKIIDESIFEGFFTHQLKESNSSRPLIH